MGVLGSGRLLRPSLGHPHLNCRFHLVVVAALLCLMTASPVEASPYGILVTGIDRMSSQADIAAYMEKVAEAGARWVRTDFWWYSVQWVGPGVVDWTYFDTVVAEAERQGLAVIPILWGTPQWAARDGVFSYGVPDMAAWEWFVAQTVSRYRGRITTWEIWNEPNFSGYWHGTPHQYAELLARAYLQVKQADPQAMVLLGGQAQIGGTSATFLAQILEDPLYPAGAYFDVHNVHTAFSSMATIAAYLQGHRNVLSQHGLSKPLVVTELSYTSDPAYQTVAGYADGEPGQARYLADAYETLLGAEVSVVVWASLRDYPNGGGSYADSGLVTTTLAIKDSFQTYYQLATGEPPSTPPPPPPQLTVSAVAVALTKPGTAQIRWTTNVAADSQVTFGTTTALPGGAQSSTLSTSHLISLSNLAQHTTYYLQLTSTTPGGLTVSSGVLSFKTK